MNVNEYVLKIVYNTLFETMVLELNEVQVYGGVLANFMLQRY